jgi:hypothetical protein
MGLGVADSIVVVVKQNAKEDMVTCLRRKRSVSSKEVKGKGSNMLALKTLTRGTTIMRSEKIETQMGVTDVFGYQNKRGSKKRLYKQSDVT